MFTKTRYGIATKLDGEKATYDMIKSWRPLVRNIKVGDIVEKATGNVVAKIISFKSSKKMFEVIGKQNRMTLNPGATSEMNIFVDD